MTTKPITTAPSTNQLQSKNFQIKPADFIKMMVTQLQNQDPMKPEDNGQLLQQMSQIGQLQSTTMLQDSVTSMMLQGQIGAAGNLIGKTVQGLDASNNNVTGLVNSVRIAGNTVSLELDNGKTLGLDKVTRITPPTTGTAAATPATAAKTTTATK